MVTSGRKYGVTTLPNVNAHLDSAWTDTSPSISPFGNIGDQIIIFQGTIAVPTFVFAFNSGIDTTGLINGWNTGGGTANNYSEIPPGLTNGTNAVSLAGAAALDNYVYVGPKTGTKAELLASISNASNWTGDDTTPYDLSPGGLNFPGSNPIFTLYLNQAPTDIALSNNSINENVAANSTVGTLTSTDPDTGNTFSYSLVAGTGSTDNYAFNISDSNLRITSSPDYEAKSIYYVRVRSTDQGGLFFEEAFIITINDLNEIALLSVSNNGNGTVNSRNTIGTNYACNSDSCDPVTFGLGDTVTLTAIGSNSTFSKWSNDYIGDIFSNPGSIIMDGNKVVTANFTADPAKVKIDDSQTPYYKIETSLAIPIQDAIVRVQATPDFVEDTVMDNTVSILIKGGYTDEGFSTQGGYTTISGSLTIQAGKLTVELLKIK
jgi:hypothetical protein